MHSHRYTTMECTAMCNKEFLSAICNVNKCIASINGHSPIVGSIDMDRGNLETSKWPDVNGWDEVPADDAHPDRWNAYHKVEYQSLKYHGVFVTFDSTNLDTGAVFADDDYGEAIGEFIDRGLNSTKHRQSTWVLTGYGETVKGTWDDEKDIAKVLGNAIKWSARKDKELQKALNDLAKSVDGWDFMGVGVFDFIYDYRPSKGDISARVEFQDADVVLGDRSEAGRADIEFLHYENGRRIKMETAGYSNVRDMKKILTRVAHKVDDLNSTR